MSLGRLMLTIGLTVALAIPVVGCTYGLRQWARETHWTQDVIWVLTGWPSP